MAVAGSSKGAKPRADQERKKRGAHIKRRGRVIPLPPDFFLVARFIQDCHAEVLAEMGGRSLHEAVDDDRFVHGRAWVELLRKWRDQLDDLLPAAADGRPRKTDRRDLAAFDRWRAEHPGRPDSQYFRQHKGAGTREEIERWRSAMRRQRNSK